MKLKLKSHLYPVALIPLITFCGDSNFQSSELSSDKNQSQQVQEVIYESDADESELAIKRHHVVDVKFSKWVNLVRIDAGVETKIEDEKCEFVNPIANDMTTSWKPFQIYWVFQERESGLKTSYNNIFTPGDKLHVSDLSKEGLKAVGFRELTSLNRKFFKITDVDLSEDKTNISGALVIPSASITKRFSVDTKLVDGSCQVITNSLDSGREVNHYYVTQNFFGAVKDVTER